MWQSSDYMEESPNLENAILYADSARGVFIPQFFAESINRDFVDTLSIALQESMAILEKGPDDEWYWEAWAEVLEDVTITHNGTTYRLFQDGDLWLVPETDF